MDLYHILGPAEGDLIDTALGIPFTEFAPGEMMTADIESLRAQIHGERLTPAWWVPERTTAPPPPA